MWYIYFVMGQLHKKNEKGRFFLRDGTQQPPLSLSIVESDDFNNCVNWHYISFSIPLRSSVFVYWQC